MQWLGGPGEVPIGRVARLRSLLPRGGALPDDVSRTRHLGVLTLLWLHLPVVFVFAVARGNSVLHAVLETGVVAVPGAAAQLSRSRREESTIFASLGLMTASAVLVHLSSRTTRSTKPWPRAWPPSWDSRATWPGTVSKRCRR